MLSYHAEPERPARQTHAERMAALRFNVSYYGLCSECYPLVSTQEDVARLRREYRSGRPKRGPRFAYPCLRGPLDGEYATTKDFETEGMYAHLAGQYVQYNSAGYRGRRIGGHPSAIYVWAEGLPALISPRNR